MLFHFVVFEFRLLFSGYGDSLFDMLKMLMTRRSDGLLLYLPHMIEVVPWGLSIRLL
jgi:hypothetical protein